MDYSSKNLNSMAYLFDGHILSLSSDLAIFVVIEYLHQHRIWSTLDLVVIVVRFSRHYDCLLTQNCLCSWIWSSVSDYVWFLSILSLSSDLVVVVVQERGGGDVKSSVVEKRGIAAAVVE